MVIESGSPRAGATAQAIVARAKSMEELESLLGQVAEEVLRFYAARHPPGQAAQNAETFLSGVCWAISEAIGLWPNDDLQDRWLLEAARRVGGPAGKAMRAYLHAERQVARMDRQMIRKEIAQEQGIRPDEVTPEEVDRYLVEALQGSLEVVREIINELDLFQLGGEE